jgi:hypothetical protein
MVYVGYSIDDYDGKSVPVSTGSTKDEAMGRAMGRAITRVLGLGITDGSIGVQECDLTDAEGERLTGLLDAWFAKKGVRS